MRVATTRACVLTAFAASACGNAPPTPIVVPTPIASQSRAVVDAGPPRQTPMDAGYDARLDGDHARALPLFLAAHDLAPPSGDALFEAAMEAKALGDVAQSRSLFARARAELETTLHAPVRVDPAPSTLRQVDRGGFDSLFSHLADGRHVSLVSGPSVLIVDPRTDRHLDVAIRSDDLPAGRFMGVLARSMIPALAVRKDDRFLAVETAGDDDPGHGFVSIVDTRTGERFGAVPATAAEDATFFFRDRTLVSSGRADAAHPKSPFAVYLVDPETRQTTTLAAPPIRDYPRGFRPGSPASLSDDGRIVMGQDAGNIVVWERSAGKVLATAMGDPNTLALLSHDGAWVAFQVSDDPSVVGAKTKIEVLRVATGRISKPLTTPACTGGAAAFDPASSRIAVANTEFGASCVAVFNLATERPIFSVSVTDQDGLDGFSPDGRELVFSHQSPGELGGGETDRLDHYSAESGAKLRSEAVPKISGSPSDGQARSPDGSRLVVNDTDGTRIVDATTRRTVCDLPEGASGDRAFSFVLGGRLLESFEYGDDIFLDPRTCAVRWSLPSRFVESVYDVAFAGAGASVEATLQQRRVQIGLASGALSSSDAPPLLEWSSSLPDGSGRGHAVARRKWDGEKHGSGDAVISVDERRVAVCVDGGVEVRDLDAGKVTTKLRGGKTRYHSITATLDLGVVVAYGLGSAPDAETLRAWDTKSGRVLWTLSEKELHIESVALSPDGRALFVSGQKAAAGRRYFDRDATPSTLVRDLTTAAPAREIARIAAKLELTPSGRRVVLTDNGPAVAIFDRDKNALAKIAVSHTLALFAIDATERVMAIGGAGRRVVFADTATGATLREAVLDDEPTSFAFSPDGRWLAVGTNLGHVAMIRIADAHVALTFGADVDGRAAIASDGRSTELLGDVALARTLVRCRIGSRSYPIELCEGDLATGIVAKALGATP